MSIHWASGGGTSSASNGLMGLELEVCLGLARAHAVLRRRFEAELGAVHGIAFGELVLMWELGQADGGRLARMELARRLGTTASGVTRQVLPLERVGLVAREPDFTDIRGGSVALTDAGRERLAEALATAEHIARELLAGLDADELRAMSKFLGRLAG